MNWGKIKKPATKNNKKKLIFSIIGKQFRFLQKFVTFFPFDPNTFLGHEERMYLEGIVISGKSELVFC